MSLDIPEPQVLVSTGNDQWEHWVLLRRQQDAVWLALDPGSAVEVLHLKVHDDLMLRPLACQGFHNKDRKYGSRCGQYFLNKSSNHRGHRDGDTPMEPAGRVVLPHHLNCYHSLANVLGIEAYPVSSSRTSACRVFHHTRCKFQS